MLGHPVVTLGSNLTAPTFVEVLQVAREDEDVRPDGDLPVRLQLLVVDGHEVLVGREQGIERALWRQ